MPGEMRHRVFAQSATSRHARHNRAAQTSAHARRTHMMIPARCKAVRKATAEYDVVAGTKIEAYATETYTSTCEGSHERASRRRRQKEKIYNAAGKSMIAEATIVLWARQVGQPSVDGAQVAGVQHAAFCRALQNHVYVNAYVPSKYRPAPACISGIFILRRLCLCSTI